MITLIVKCTDGCNLRCRYCSAGEKECRPHTIDAETLNKAVDYAAAYADTQGEQGVTLIVHGGEPTLVDCEVYRAGFEHACKSQAHLKWRFGMQTNGYCIPERFLQLFNDYAVGVCVSIDGNELAHDSNRVTAAGSGSYRQVLANIGEMKRRGISVTALAVLTKRLLSEDLSYLLYYNYHDIHIKINPLLSYGEAVKEDNLWLKPGEYADYLIAVFRYMMEMELDIEISPIAELFSALVSDTPMHGCSCRQVCGRTIIGVDWKGDLFPCGRFCDLGKPCLGNIWNSGVYEPENICTLDDECKACRYLKWCNNGCEACRCAKGVTKNPLCVDMKKLFAYFSDQGITEYIAYLQRKKQELVDLLEDEENNCE